MFLKRCIKNLGSLVLAFSYEYQKNNVPPHTKVLGLNGFLDAQRALQPKGSSYREAR